MFFKLLRYDLRNGLLRWRYLSAVLIFVMPCFSCWFRILPHHGSGTWADWMLYCFKGVFPPGDQLEGFEFPILWFVTIVGGLFISLDYPLNDLTDVGQQIIIRTVKKYFFHLHHKKPFLVNTYSIYMCAKKRKRFKNFYYL